MRGVNDHKGGVHSAVFIIFILTQSFQVGSSRGFTHAKEMII